MPSWLEPFLEGWQSGLVWAFAGVAIAGIINHFKKEPKLLEYKKISTELVTKNISQIPGLVITMDGKPVESLTSTNVVFLNSGSKSIWHKDSFRDTEPLLLTVKNGHFFGEEHGFDIYPKDSKAKPEIIRQSDTSAEICFDCMERDEKFKITVFHTGELSVDGKPVDGKMKEYKEENPKLRDLKSGLAVVAILILLSVIASLLGIDLANNEGAGFLMLIVWFITSIIIAFFDVKRSNRFSFPPRPVSEDTTPDYPKREADP